MTLCTSNLTTGFIDLATYDEIEKYMYGGPDATAYFVRETRKATWFTQVPVVLSRSGGAPAFGADWSVTISRAGDYLLSTWLRLTVPEVKPKFNGADKRIRWTRNFMHNLIKEVCITFNDLVAARFDNFHLDFWSAFTVPTSKRTGYNNMIGSVRELNEPSGPGGYQETIPARTLNLPLPFFYSRDTGVALPTAALPYNEMKINFSFRNWTELLILDDLDLYDTAGSTYSRAPTTDELESEPVLTDIQVWSNYAIVSNDERKRMACAPRDMLIEQVQTAPRQTFNPKDSAPRFDIRFSHAIKVIFFAVRNKTIPSVWSNYTTASHVPAGTSVSYTPPGALDPILSTSLIYENTNRLSQLGSDYFSLINPWYHAPAIPTETGYHMYSYSLDFVCLDPMGSTNYGKLTNVSIVPEPSPAALIGNLGSGLPSPAGSTAEFIKTRNRESGVDFPQSYEFVTTAINNNVIRISGGALGFPVL